MVAVRGQVLDDLGLRAFLPGTLSELPSKFFRGKTELMSLVGSFVFLNVFHSEPLTCN